MPIFRARDQARNNGLTSASYSGSILFRDWKSCDRIIDGEPTSVTVNYPEIDEGKTRIDENQGRLARNVALRSIPTSIGRNAAAWSPISDALGRCRDRARRTPLRTRHAPRWHGEDADPRDVQVVREYMSERTDRKAERQAREASREHTDAVAEIWESQLSQLARGRMDAMRREEEERERSGFEH
jgi:hypothetical protein